MWGLKLQMPSRSWTFFMFFFNMSPAEETSKDCFMKQKPFNDNLVMASIESLYEQASHSVRPNYAGLQRHNTSNLPIIGSLPVQIGQQEGTSDFDDIVLTGRLHAAFADDKRTKFATETDPDKEQEGNPFLEIRQAVIDAGNNNSQKFGLPEPSTQAKLDLDSSSINATASMLPDELETQSTEQTFAEHLANLIDAEIERRMAVRRQGIKKTLKKNASASETNPKQRRKAKKSKKIKEKAARNPAAKKPSTTKRIKPK